MSREQSLSKEMEHRSRWCIVLADERGPERTPVQFCHLDEAVTPLQKALHRATAVAPASQVIVTAFAGYRTLWEPSVWFVRPERRFVGDSPTASQQSSAAAILSVAACSPSHVIIILPARCYVAHELILRRAINRALLELPGIPEGVVTLGMLDLEEGIDEDYLVVGRPRAGRGLRVDAFARRPTAWIARHLWQQGALVASGIMIGYAGVFAAHVSKSWPGISKQLARLGSIAAEAGAECKIASSLGCGVPPRVLQSLRWCPPAFPQRVFGVYRSGWSGLRSPRSVAHVTHFLSRRAYADLGDLTGEQESAPDDALVEQIS